jgi:hypothetical protein
MATPGMAMLHMATLSTSTHIGRHMERIWVLQNIRNPNIHAGMSRHRRTRRVTRGTMRRQRRIPGRVRLTLRRVAGRAQDDIFKGQSIRITQAAIRCRAGRDEIE